MNCKRFIAAILAAFATVWLTDFLIHGVWLSSTYGATKELWRPEAEMPAKMPWMLAGQFVVAATFTSIFAGWVAEKRCLRSTWMFSLAVGAMVGGGQIIMYAVQPFPGMLVVKWCVAYLLQTLVLGTVVHFVYKPAAAPACCDS